MDNVFHRPITLTRCVGSTKSRRDRPFNQTNSEAGVSRITRTKSLLGAALRVWELKQRVSD